MNQQENTLANLLLNNAIQVTKGDNSLAICAASWVDIYATLCKAACDRATSEIDYNSNRTPESEKPVGVCHDGAINSATDVEDKFFSDLRVIDEKAGKLEINTETAPKAPRKKRGSTETPAAAEPVTETAPAEVVEETPGKSVEMETTPDTGNSSVVEEVKELTEDDLSQYWTSLKKAYLTKYPITNIAPNVPNAEETARFNAIWEGPEGIKEKGKAILVKFCGFPVVSKVAPADRAAVLAEWNALRPA